MGMVMSRAASAAAPDSAQPGPADGVGAAAEAGALAQPLVDGAIAAASRQYRWLLTQLPEEGKLPRSFADGKWQMVFSRDWTSGFFPGSLWYLYEATGDSFWREAATRYTALLEQEQTNRRTHDVGFMLNCSYGNGYRLTQNPAYREVLLRGAQSLSTRFNPAVGMIRSWDHGAWKYPVIIDNMMNLELLLWAAKEGAQPRLREVALSHADRTILHHFRPDHSTWHVVDFNPADGAVLKKQTHQGAADDSAWARGQSWGLYGYTMMFRETRKPEYLAQAEKIARFLMNHPRLPADKVPYWDYDAPGIPAAPRDASAAAIMASALIELSQLGTPEFGRQCLQFARAQLRSLASPAYFAKPGENGGFLLKHCVGHLPKNSEVDVPLNYADYYFLEALLRYRQRAEPGKALPAPGPKSAATQGKKGGGAKTQPADLRIQPDPALPNVLLLGDSISIGYTLPVRARLKGSANVFRPVNADGSAENCADTGKGLAALDRWLALAPKWDVIHFNWGLHDLKHVKPGTPGPATSSDPNDPPLRSLEEYRANLEKIVVRLQQTGARLVFATTTPVPEGVGNPYRNPADPARYNAAAKEVMQQRGVRVNDLYASIAPRLAEFQLPRNVHFNAKGSDALAGDVAKAIAAELAAKAAAK